MLKRKEWIELSPVYFIVLILIMLIVLFTGIPVAFGLGAVSVITALMIWGSPGLMMVANSAYSTFTTDNYLAIPMFLMMASLLQKSGMADDLYEMMYKWMGSLKGGLAMGTIIICAIFGAMSGGSGPATISMGLIALPSMLSRGYNKHLAVGSVAAGGILGIIIPPSIPMIILSGFSTGLSVGKLFTAGILPGILCATIYIIYIAIVCRIKPELGPPVPADDRATWQEKFRLLWALVAPLLLIVLVLGSIYSGAATPTEAAGIGAMGTLVITILKRKLTARVLSDALSRTLSLTAMILWILIGAGTFNTIYNYMGAATIMGDIADSLPGGRYSVLLIIMLINFLLGMLMDDYAIITLTAPLYLPIIAMLGFDPLWFAMLFMLNLQMAYLTPPFGFNLFYLKSIVPADVKLTDIYRGIVPFVLLQILALILVILFPQIATFLPGRM